MRELIGRLTRSPSASGYLLLASLVINVLGLMSSLYVILVLNRYVSYGVTATLVSLTVGVVIAILAEHGFRRLRLRLAEEIVGNTDEGLAVGVYGLLLTARIDALERQPPGERAELVRGIERAELALGPSNLAALADVPFSLLFLVALVLLSPPLAAVAGSFCLASVALAWWTQYRLTRPVHTLSALGERINALVGATIMAADTIRQFRGAGLLMAQWRATSGQARATRATVALYQHDGLSFAQAMQALMGTAVIATGATLVVAGQLDIGALIGANLIAVRALAPLTRLVQMAEAFKNAEQSLTSARRFAQTPGEPEGGRVPPGWSRRLELRGVGLLVPGRMTPLFSSLDLILEPGGVLVITGRNGTGKSSLLRLLAGLIEPARGQVLVDGVDLRQISLEWWRRQVSYVPQEPTFIDGTIRENLTAARPEATEADLLRCLTFVGLRGLIDHHPQGLDQDLAGAGRNLAPGLRRRLAMARAMLVDAPLFLLDEPSEGLDREGAEAVYTLLIDLTRSGKTLVVVSHDPTILRGARLLLRFDGHEPTLHAVAPAAVSPATPAPVAKVLVTETTAP
jgi:ATP-binding cassette subfamily C protein LapB